MINLNLPVFSESASYAIRIEKARDIPGYCSTFAIILAEKPLFDGTGSIFKKCKVIAFESIDDAKICDIFNKNTRQIIGNDFPWHIRSFDEKNRLLDSNKQEISQGLTLWLIRDVDMCSLEILQDSYNQVLQGMTTGWVSANLEDNPNIMFEENREEFSLYIKEKSLIEENILIHLIANKIFLREDIKCHHSCLTQSGKNKLYLWIRKSTFEIVVDKFGFQF